MEWYKPITNLVAEPITPNSWVRVAVSASQTQNNNINRLIWKNFSDRMVSFAIDKVAVVMNNQYTEDLVMPPLGFTLPSSAPNPSSSISSPPAEG